MTRLASLTLNLGSLKELPCLEPFTELQYLSLELPPDLTRLPSSIGKLAGLRELTLACCGGITKLPSIERLTSLETLLIIRCGALRELPASVDALTALRTLQLVSLPNLTTLPVSIGALTVFTGLTLNYCGLADVPSSI